MDTRLCDGVYALADGCDMLVIESTFLDEDEQLAVDFGHLTAGQAARVARDGAYGISSSPTSASATATPGSSSGRRGRRGTRAS
ncbi:hypothetical protein SHKM778_77580 [Streptomyces sp. KM77-8]|uniref:Uncharacterized protein n=1 Tax=Streptomyces haneummycinicus TaxID=3074435 RepID=A0AAT9HW57_9ACTN